MKFLVQPLIQSLYKWYRQVIRNPKYRWWIVLGSLLYLLGPIDISPDIFPVVGWIDDGMVATLLVTELSQVLLEQLKSRREGTATVSETAPQPTVQSAQSAVVDVDAVSVG
jgi:uncharacterized membrane protein YkvA (DUF1232 family)